MQLVQRIFDRVELVVHEYRNERAMLSAKVFWFIILLTLMSVVVPLSGAAETPQYVSDMSGDDFVYPSPSPGHHPNDNAELRESLLMNEPPIQLEYIHGLNKEVENDNFLRVSVEPVFAIDSAVLSHGDRNVFSNAQVSNLDKILTRVMRTNFKHPDRSLQNLRAKGFSAETLQTLEYLKNQAITDKDTFLNGVEEHLEGDQPGRYEDPPLNHTSVYLPGSSVGLVNALEVIDFWEKKGDLERNIRNLEAWKSTLYYPMLIKETLTYSKSKKPRVQPRSTVPFEDNDIIIDILEFFKRWGVPRPLTVVLFAIAIYLVLAFLARGE